MACEYVYRNLLTWDLAYYHVKQQTEQDMRDELNRRAALPTLVR